MEQHQPILDAVDPEIVDRLVDRREAIKKSGTAGAAFAAGLKVMSVPLALAALSKETFAQGLPADIKAVLDFALTLEIFEDEFYRAVLGTSSVAAQNAAFATVRTAAAAVPGAVPTLQQISKHETAHVAFLRSVGATSALTAASFDFTGARGAGNGPFARATTELQFLLLVAQAAEDTGVRAYKGQAGNLLSNKTVLEAALRIHSVEARHAARVRRMRRATNATLTDVRFSGTVRGGGAAAAGAGNITNPPTEVVNALGLIYGGATSEANLTHGAGAGVNVTTLAGVTALGLVGTDLTAAAQEAFDEPLTRAEVVTIVQPFFIPTIS